MATVLRKAPSGRELPTKSGEGERVAIKQVQDKVARAPSVTLRVPPSSRRKAYVRAVSLLIVGSGFCLIVGSGFCPIVRGYPRAMLAPDASVGKAEYNTS